MILGILKEQNYRRPIIEIEYFPLYKGEKMNIFKKLKQDNMTNIHFPYRFYDFYTGKERESPAEGWKVYENLPIYLARGEEHFRIHTINFLSKVNISSETVFFDPACSFGDFLESIKKQYSSATTVGCDLSRGMVDIARDKLDEVHWENAFDCSLEEESADFLFLRFLNFRVVTYENAHKLYDILINKVKVNGYVICFGHTPVLLEKEHMIRKDIRLLSCSGYEEENDSLFQFYILKKVTSD
jgi:SAM-dependent methyltransferase